MNIIDLTLVRYLNRTLALILPVSHTMKGYKMITKKNVAKRYDQNKITFTLRDRLKRKKNSTHDSYQNI